MIMEREVAFTSKVADAAIVLDSIFLPSLPEESDELVKKRCSPILYVQYLRTV